MSEVKVAVLGENSYSLASSPESEYSMNDFEGPTPTTISSINKSSGPLIISTKSKIPLIGSGGQKDADHSLSLVH